MTWTVIEQIAKIAVWITGIIGCAFLAGQIWQKIRRGEVGDIRLTPIQQIAQDVKQVQTQIHDLSVQLGKQFTDIAGQVSEHHQSIRRLTTALEQEYVRLCGESGFLYSRQMVDQKLKESEVDRNKIHVEVEAVKARFDRRS